MVDNILNEEKNKLLTIKRTINKELIKAKDIIDIYESDNKFQGLLSSQKVDKKKYMKSIDYLKQLKMVKKELYYQRIDVLYDNRYTEKVYIGKKDLIVNNKAIIVSWTAPIADVYKQYDIGSFNHIHEETNGKKLRLSGEIIDKRQILIQNGDVIEVISLKNKINNKEIEKFIAKKIDSVSTDNLGSIVETMQKEQNDIIRLPLEKCALVHGGAGSGKSSVAFHRLAYLSYRYKLNKEDIIAIGPNNIFMDYTKGLLLELGSDFDVKQLTFTKFIEEVLKEDFKKFDNLPKIEDKNLNVLKTSKRFKDVIDKYIDHVDLNFISDEDIFIDNFKIINNCEIKRIWENEFKGYKLNEKILKFKKYLLEKLKYKVDKYMEFAGDIYTNNIEKIKQVDLPQNQYNELKKLNMEQMELSKKRLTKSFSYIINNYLNKMCSLNAFNLYYKFISNKNLIEEISKDIIDIEEIDLLKNYAEKINVTHIDAIVALYIHCKINDLKNSYRHIVVDECQDMSYMEFVIIEELTNSFTLVGDFNQRIKINKELVSIDEINNLFSKYTFFDTYYLNKSFRNSKNITEYANEIMKPYFINEKYIPQAFDRKTEKPKVFKYENNTAVINKVLSNIEKYIVNNKNKNIAIILKNDQQVIKWNETIQAINKNLKINLLENESNKYVSGISILAAPLSKGLEFDYVLVPDADSYGFNEDDRKLLYVVVTRALHKLELFLSKTSFFINSINKDLWEEKDETGNDIIVNGLINTIKPFIVKQIGEVPKEIEKRLSEINDINFLTEIIIKIKEVETFEDLNKILK